MLQFQDLYCLDKADRSALDMYIQRRVGEHDLQHELMEVGTSRLAESKSIHWKFEGGENRYMRLSAHKLVFCEEIPSFIKSDALCR